MGIHVHVAIDVDVGISIDIGITIDVRVLVDIGIAVRVVIVAVIGAGTSVGTGLIHIAARTRAYRSAVSPVTATASAMRRGKTVERDAGRNCEQYK